MYGWMDGWMEDVCMYVCMYVYLRSQNCKMCLYYRKFKTHFSPTNALLLLQNRLQYDQIFYKKDILTAIIKSEL